MGRRKARDVSFKYVYATLYGNCEMEDTLESIITVSEEDMKAMQGLNAQQEISDLLSYEITQEIDELYKTCDYITIHVPYTKDNDKMINEAKIAEMLDDRLSESDEDLIDDLGLDMNEIIESMNRKAKDLPNESNET